MAATPFAYIAAGHHQIAFVVKDLKAAERFFSEKMGAPRFFPASLHIEHIEHVGHIEIKKETTF